MKKVIKIAAICIVVAVLMSALLGCSSRSTAVIFSVDGQIVKDASFNELSYNAARTVFGSKKVQVEERATGADYPSDLRTLLKKKPGAVIAPNYASGQVITQIAPEEYPDTYFVTVDYTITKDYDNVASLTFRSGEGAFVAGYVAALYAAEKGNPKVGFLGVMQANGTLIPEIASFANGFKNGVAQANLELDVAVTLKEDHILSFQDFDAGKSKAISMYRDGVEVLFAAAGVGGLGAIEAAKEEKKYIIGVDYDQNSLAPVNMLGSVIKDVEGALTALLKEYWEGDKTKAAGSFQYGLKDGGVDFVSNTALLSESIAQKTATLKQNIADGTVVI